MILNCGFGGPPFSNVLRSELILKLSFWLCSEQASIHPELWGPKFLWWLPRMGGAPGEHYPLCINLLRWSCCSGKKLRLNKFGLAVHFWGSWWMAKNIKCWRLEQWAATHLTVNMVIYGLIHSEDHPILILCHFLRLIFKLILEFGLSLSLLLTRLGFWCVQSSYQYHVIYFICSIACCSG